MLACWQIILEWFLAALHKRLVAAQVLNERGSTWANKQHGPVHENLHNVDFGFGFLLASHSLIPSFRHPSQDTELGTRFRRSDLQVQAGQQVNNNKAKTMMKTTTTTTTTTDHTQASNQTINVNKNWQQQSKRSIRIDSNREVNHCKNIRNTNDNNDNTTQTKDEQRNNRTKERTHSNRNKPNSC